jgi:hypothetical protein
MNFTNLMEGVLLIVSTGFAPGSIVVYYSWMNRKAMTGSRE